MTMYRTLAIYTHSSFLCSLFSLFFFAPFIHAHGYTLIFCFTFKNIYTYIYICIAIQLSPTFHINSGNAATFTALPKNFYIQYIYTLTVFMVSLHFSPKNEYLYILNELLPSNNFSLKYHKSSVIF